MNTDELQSLLNEQKDLKYKLFYNLNEQIINNKNDLKELSATFYDNLVRPDGSPVCSEMCKIILFNTNLLESNTVNVCLNTTNDKIEYDSFDSETGVSLPQELNAEKLQILLSLNDNYENAMFATNPEKVINSTISNIKKNNEELSKKIQ